MIGVADVGSSFFDVLVEIDAMLDSSQLSALLAKMLDLYDLKSVAYIGSGIMGRPEEGPYLAVTYSPEWVEHYRAQRFIDVDPAIQVGMRRMLPVDWSEFDRDHEKIRRLFGEAGEFGLGSRGISVPVNGRYGDRALVSITSNASDRDWLRVRPEYMRDFQVFALHLHQAILRVVGGQLTEQANLSPRELECLIWIAEGKTYWETSVILGLSPHTVRCYLESARHKLGAANNTHAVNKAGKARLLSLLP